MGPCLDAGTYSSLGALLEAMTDLVQLAGSPAARGQRLGQLQESAIKRALASFLAASENGGESVDYAGHARELASQINLSIPEWLIEARATASGASVPVATFLGINALANNTQFCETQFSEDRGLAFAAAGQACRGAKATLHLNFDANRTPMCAFSRAASPGTLAYVALAATGDLGANAFVNEKGLAGCWLSGPEVEHAGVGLKPALFLRAVAERCLDCRQALQRFQELQGRFGMNAPKGRGTTFLFADANGEVLQLESGSIRHAAGFQSQGLMVVANHFQLPDSPKGEQARDVFRQKVLKDQLMAKPIDIGWVLECARLPGQDTQRGVSNSETMATFTAVLGTPSQSGWACAHIGPPAASQPLVLFPEAGVPIPVLDGSVWCAADDLMQTRPPALDRKDFRNTYTNQLNEVLAAVGQSGWTTEHQAALINKSYELFLDFVDEAACPICPVKS